MKAAVGLDLGGTKMAAGIVTADGRLLHRRSEPTRAWEGADSILARMQQLIMDLLEEARAEDLAVTGIGLGIPGLMDSERGISLVSPNLPFEHTPVLAPIREAFGLPAYMDNDVRVHTRGEWLLGAGRGVQNLILLTLGTGIGGGIILNGAFFKGPTESAGEVGHQTLLPDGPECGCGNRGCLEALASGPAIGREARLRLQMPDGRQSLLWPQFAQDPASITAREVAEAARQGDALALAVLEQAGRWLGVGLANLVNLFNPDLIIIGGGAARIGEPLLGPAREELQRRAMSVPRGHVRLAMAELGEDAGIYGAAALVPELEEALRQ